VRDFVHLAFAEIGVSLEFQGTGVGERAIVTACNDERYQLPLGKEVVAVDPRYFRPAEVDLLVGDPRKAKEKLGWTPTYDLPALVQEMVQADLYLFERDAVLLNSGYEVKREFE
jgi:GDPmannose 4,6-dehydratase